MPEHASSLIETLFRDQSRFFETVIAPDLSPDLLPLLGAIAIACFAIYGAIVGAGGGIRQSFASSLKVPLLFVLTLAACVPSLFVLNLLNGSKIGALQMTTLIAGAIALTAVVLVSFTPIAALFAINSEYQFMKLLHVLVFALSAVVGVRLLNGGLAAAATNELILPATARRLSQLWLLIYAFAGMQLAWLLRPFVGDPNLPFQWFRPKEAGMNFFIAVWKSLRLVAAHGRTKPAAGTTSGPSNRAKAS